MSRSENKALKRIAMADVEAVQALLRRWDPIGLGDMAPSDEYDSYAPHIVTLVRQDADHKAIARHLGLLQTAHMGMPETAAWNEEVACLIVKALASSPAD